MLTSNYCTPKILAASNRHSLATYRTWLDPNKHIFQLRAGIFISCLKKYLNINILNRNNTISFITCFFVTVQILHLPSKLTIKTLMITIKCTNDQSEQYHLQVYSCTDILHQILYGDGKYAAQGVSVLRNQIFENPRWRTAAILDFDFGP